MTQVERCECPEQEQIPLKATANNSYFLVWMINISYTLLPCYSLVLAIIILKFMILRNIAMWNRINKKEFTWRKSS